MGVIKFHVSDFLGKKKMTQKELSELTGIRPATVSALYHDNVKRIEVDHLAKMCEVFDCEPGDLITYVKEGVEDKL